MHSTSDVEYAAKATTGSPPDVEPVAVVEVLSSLLLAHADDEARMTIAEIS
ncbi:MAG: hypothetical protein OSA87_05940 [Woeseiaceae bacterium]|nr:hypothetical protein [Woeseiaceae bacterium]